MVTNIQLIYEHPIDRIIFGRASPQVKKVVYEALQDKPQVLRKIIDRAAIEGSYLAKIIALKQHEAVDVIFEAAKNHPHLLDGVLAENDDSAATLYRHLNSGELKAATLLLMAGADHRYRPDENHSTVFDLAVLHGAQEAVEVLKQRDPKAMISMRTSQGYFNSVHQDEIFYADYFARKWGYQPSYLKEEKPGVLKEFPITKIPLTDDPILIEVGDPQGRDTSATILASGLEVTAKLKAEDSSHYVLDEERRPLSAEKIGKLKKHNTPTSFMSLRFVIK